MLLGKLCLGPKQGLNPFHLFSIFVLFLCFYIRLVICSCFHLSLFSVSFIAQCYSVRKVAAVYKGLGLLGTEDKNTTILRNVSNYRLTLRNIVEDLQRQ